MLQLTSSIPVETMPVSVILVLFVFILMITFGEAENITMNVDMKLRDTSVQVDMNLNETVIDYLSKFGYLRRDDRYKYNISNVKYMVAIEKFQDFNGVNADALGVMDVETEKKMNQRRHICPSLDIIDKVGIFPRRKRRYILQGSKWKSGYITYRIIKYPSNSSTRMTNTQVDKQIEKAFDIWSSHANLTFIHRKKGYVKIKISFEEGEHGDDDEFDGFGGILGHGYFPVYGGHVHFDNAEEWVRDGELGMDESRTPIDLLSVAAHEFGHALGLSHSKSVKSLMAPYYRRYDPNLKLDKDDIEAIQKLYGPKDQRNLKMDREPQDCNNKRCLCENIKIDTMVTYNGSSFLFSGDIYWKIGNRTQVEVGYPRNVTDDWKGLPGNLDASFSWKNGKTFFFKGKYVWRFSDFSVDPGFPKRISKKMSGIPDNINAAFFWPVTQLLYIFKGCKYWEYNPMGKPGMKSSSPRPISDIPGFPGYIDSALYFINERAYVFSDGWYYRINKDNLSMDTDTKYPFPRLIINKWFDCPKHNTSRQPLQNYCRDEPKLLEEMSIAGFD